MDGWEWPEDEIFTPTCSGEDEMITMDGYAGEYSVVALTEGVSYTFESSVATDFLTIANNTGTIAHAIGTTPVVWTATSDGNFRMYNHSNADCDVEAVDRTRSVRCISNDICDGATVLTSDVAVTGSINTATVSTVPSGSCDGVPGSGANDFWYSITPLEDAIILVDQLVEDSEDLVLEVLSGSCSSPVVEYCDASAFGGGLNTIMFNGTAGTTYYIRTYGYAGHNVGDFSITAHINYDITYGNDDCIDAIDLPIGTTCTNTLSSTSGATWSGSFPSPDCGSPTVDVWFKYTVPSGISFVDINFDSLEGSGDLVAQIYESTDNTCSGTISLVACSNDAGTSAMPGFQGLSAVAGKTYFMRVWSYEAGEYDDFSVCIVERVVPENDECANAIELTPGTTLAGSNGAATVSSLPGGTCSEDDGITEANDVWYSVTADYDGTIDVLQTVDFGADLVLDVLSGSCASSSEIACQSNAWTIGFNEVSFPAIAGTTYFIRTYGYAGSELGTFTLDISGDALPVTMNDLKGKVANNNALLSWNTFSEQNNRGFEIQRSIDGKQFGKVGFVASLADNGNSSQNLSYHFTDATPINGAAYYRLQQIDIDGKTALSNVVRLSATDNSNGLSIIATPNPVANNLKVSIVGNRAENGVIQIADITGKVVKSIAVNATDVFVDMVDMATGVYFVRYNDNLQSQVIKVVKQ